MTDEYSDNKEDGTPKFEEKIKLLDLFLSFKGRIGIGPFWIGSGAHCSFFSFLSLMVNKILPEHVLLPCYRSLLYGRH